MKNEIHPHIFNVRAQCVCGNSFETTSTKEKLNVDICSKCHPYFTGAQKFLDTAGRIEKFERRFKKGAK